MNLYYFYYFYKLNQISFKESSLKEIKEKTKFLDEFTFDLYYFPLFNSFFEEQKKAA
jgi:hypothetical protein